MSSSGRFEQRETVGRAIEGSINPSQTWLTILVVALVIALALGWARGEVWITTGQLLPSH
jgi:hypothetical protein